MFFFFLGTRMADNVIKFNEFNDKELKIVGHHVLCVELITVSLFSSGQRQ